MPTYADFGDPIGDYCEALSFSFGMGVQQAAGGPRHKAQLSDASFTKETDSLSADLMRACVDGTTIPSVTLEVWNEKACTLMCTMKDVIIASFQRSGARENIYLDFESISYRTFT
jgi:type VI protein secretion system component Hcp